MMQNFKIKEKRNLTHDVYKIIFESEKEINLAPGQFITFLLDKIGGRAYSVLEQRGKDLALIIKKREIEDGGRGGSKLICEKEVGDILKGVGPVGHFLLKENDKNKLFIGTGTGLVPLYNQILAILEKSLNIKYKLIFGVRTLKDLFYIEEFKKIKEQNPNFDFEIYISREKDEKYNSGYVTDFLTKENLENFEEFYICGAPGMIDSAKETLEKLGKNDIYFEKYA